MSNEAILICAAPDTRWPLTLAEFESSLRGRWPNVRTWVEHSPRTNDDHVTFGVDFDDYTRHGTFFNGQQLALHDDVPSFWADTIEWFLSLLPSDARVVGIMEAVPEMEVIPRDATADQIVTILDDLNSR